MLLKRQGCLNQTFEEENLIQSGHEQYFMRLFFFLKNGNVDYHASDDE